MENDKQPIRGQRIIISLLACFALGCADSDAADASRALPRAFQTQVQDTLRAARNADITSSRRSAIIDAAAAASPSVVSVNVIRRVRQRARRSFLNIGVPREYERLVEGVGSGFIISSDGLAITNQHVTDGAEQIVVTTSDGVDRPATLVGEDPLTDIAVLRVEGSNLPVSDIGSSKGLEIGEWVVAIGNPYSYLLGNTEPSVTAGVVSAVGRNILPDADQQGIYVDMIQTDAAINPGNSGGPLVDALGRVIGVNSSIFTRSGGSVGIGFAIPIERALRVAQELQEEGEVRRAWVGIDVPGAEDLRGWKTSGGLTISSVVPNSPAADAGVRTGDILLMVNDRPVRTFLDWEAAKLQVGPGDTLLAMVRRGGTDQVRRLVVSSLPSTRAEVVEILDIELISVTPAIQSERDLERDHGALIVSLGDRVARQTGLRPGDVILSINRRLVNDAAELRSLFQASAGRGAIRAYFHRAGRLRYTDFFIR